jgi:hypothetical protein
MAEREQAGIGHRRLAPFERRELGGIKRLQDRGESFGALRVAVAGVMIEAGRMGKEQGGQNSLAAFRSFQSCVGRRNGTQPGRGLSAAITISGRGLIAPLPTFAPTTASAKIGV